MQNSQTLNEYFQSGTNKKPAEVKELLTKFGLGSGDIMRIIESNPIDSLHPDVVAEIVKYGNHIIELRNSKIKKAVITAADSNVSYKKMVA